MIKALRIFENDARILEVASNLKQTTVSRIDIVRQQKSLLASQLAALSGKEESLVAALTHAVSAEHTTSSNVLDRHLRQLELDREKLRGAIAVLDDQEHELATNIVEPKDLKHSLKALFDKLSAADEARKARNIPSTLQKYYCLSQK